MLVRGSDKTPKTRNVIETVEKPTLILASNETLALEFQEVARLCDEIPHFLSVAFGISPRKGLSAAPGPLAPPTALLLP